MSSLSRTLKRSGLPVLLVLCLAALSVFYASADEAQRPLAVQIIGDPDAAVNGRFAVGTASVGSKELTVVGVIDFLGAGTVHNYFTQGTGNNMQINTNVDESNVVGDASRSQWKLVLGSSLDWFSIRRSPAGATYNEDALFFIEGSTGNVGIATVDTNNGATIPFTFQGRLHVEATSGHAVYGYATASTGTNTGVYGRSDSPAGYGVAGWAAASTGTNHGVLGESDSNSGYGVFGVATATTGATYGVYGESASTAGFGLAGFATATSGNNFGVYGQSDSMSGRAVYGYASATTGTNYGVYGDSSSTAGTGVRGVSGASTGTTYGVYGRSYSTSGTGVYGLASANAGSTYGVFGQSDSTYGRGVYGWASASTGYADGLLGQSDSASGCGVNGFASATTGINYGVYGLTNSATGYGVFSYGDLRAIGDITATGSKAAIVETQDYGWRHLYAMESPQNWFEDFGQDTLVAGEAVVPIEPIFAQTVNMADGYHVFLTPRGGFCSLYVAEVSPSAFTVRANEGAGCEIAFDYRIVAPRLDFEDLRLEPAEDPEAVAASLPMLE